MIPNNWEKKIPRDYIQYFQTIHSKYYTMTEEDLQKKYEEITNGRKTKLNRQNLANALAFLDTLNHGVNLYE